MPYDVYVVHASEDKATCVTPLAKALKQAGLIVWLDDWEIKPGDSLRQRMDDGLAQSRFGVTVISPRFFEKKWPQAELDALIGKERMGEEVIIPIWLDVDREAIEVKSPILASRKALRWSDGMARVVEGILERVRATPELQPAVTESATVEPLPEPIGPLFLLTDQDFGMTIFEARAIEADQKSLKTTIPNPEKGVALAPASDPATCWVRLRERGRARSAGDLSRAGDGRR